ncbi:MULTISPECIES: thiol reductant ABC exporter subunit CydC [unclassified Pseudoxanthomonas]|uniref:thiol reductant ABC exporter subunit CydC n=1 Tax=unclassified Pseudoxanthomonas TaxID=2645906 RepID=UPI001618A721|nr:MULTISPECIES: thiol reductant ABC exporter subunit CydC [unclassified Pseudoxanthomonas]MBB3276731.1 ATP-binding cassette subfamily C protein CydC [Pseudoxanthomonas sp. OG2]MBV7472197.1 thiol reductant ABC exporter subunit CydC [Pseudoxanthomonas sp. PXM05]
MSARPDDLRGVLRRHAGGIALTFALLLITLLAGTGLLGLAGHFLTAAALAGSAAIGFNFFGPSAGIRAFTFARILSRYAEKLVGHDVTLALAKDLRVWFFRRALPLAPLGLGRYRVGDLLARLVADIEAADGLLVRALGPLVSLATVLSIGVAVAAWRLPVAGLLLAVAFVLIAVAVPWAIQAGARGLERERAEARARLRYAVLEGLEGASDLVALDAVDGWLARVDADAVALAGRERQRKRRLALGVLLHGLLAAALLPALGWLLFDAVDARRLSAPAAGGLFFMTLALLEAAAGIGVAWQAWQAARASARRLDEVAMQQPEIDDPADPVPVPAHGPLVLEGVAFAWPGEARRLLDGVDLVLAPGRRIAIRGDSGAGKSSLLALLLRLRDPDAGRLLYAGHDLRRFRGADWHARQAWLPQDAPVFAGSVRDNLRIGDPGADDAKLWRALAQVRLDTLVRNWSDGLDGWVGESGATLSAGQARRLALARALLRDTPLLLLDEPTEGLDQDTADALMRDIAEAVADRAVLIITHAPLPPGTVHESHRLIDGRLWPDPEERSELRSTPSHIASS